MGESSDPAEEQHLSAATAVPSLASEGHDGAESSEGGPALTAHDLEVLARLVHGKPWFTWAIMGVCLVVFAVSTYLGGATSSPVLLRLGANVASQVMDGAWWRLWASTFLHIGLVHLLVNMYSLYNVGPAIEAILGRAGLATVYALSGLGGAVFSCFMHRADPVLAAGASGAIFGLFGALACLSGVASAEVSPALRGYLGRGTLSTIGVNLLYGFSTPGVDNSAHVGGLVTGCVVTWLLISPPGRVLRSHAVGIGVLLGVGSLPLINEGYVAWMLLHPTRVSAQAPVLYRDPAGRFEVWHSRALVFKPLKLASSPPESSSGSFEGGSLRLVVVVGPPDPTLRGTDLAGLARLLGDLKVTHTGARRQVLGRYTWALLPSAAEPEDVWAVASSDQHSCLVLCSCHGGDAQDAHAELDRFLTSMRF